MKNLLREIGNYLAILALCAGVIGCIVLFGLYFSGALR